MHRRRDAGLTMLEILIVVAILAILAAVLIPNLLASKLAANEAAAIALLRSMVAAEAQVLGSAKIDADSDAAGEYGTFVEITGAVGVRKRVGTTSGSDFTSVGSTIDPPAVSETFIDMLENTGYMVKGGYAVMIFLPDTSNPVKWTHEVIATVVTGRGRRRITSSQLSFTGGSNRCGIDLSESIWCAYAQPVNRGRSGRRAFFTNQQGDILQSQNDTAKHTGFATAISGDAAFTGAAMTSEVAVGTKGKDGDVWKATN